MDESINGIDASVIKGGETCMEANFKRSTRGLSVTVKVHPSVEEYIKALGSGEALEPKIYGGRHWFPLDGRELMIYELSTDPGVMITDGGIAYSINRPGSPLIHSGLDGDRMSNTINLSFLRLVGVSEQNGVTFGVKGVFTYKAIQDLAKSTGDAFRRFYIDYMKPINSDVKIVRQQW